MNELIQKLEELIVDVVNLPDHRDKTIANDLNDVRLALSAARRRALDINSIKD